MNPQCKITCPSCVHSMDEITDEAAGILAMVPNYSRINGVEVGTLRGKTASILLLRRPGLFLSMVDPFWTDGIVKDSREAVREAAYYNTRFARHRRMIIEKSSLEAVAGFEDDSVDFAYLDGDHRYDGVLADCRAWWQKVRPGGILCGHDYGRPRPAGTLEDQGEWGVEPAVLDFCREASVELCHEDRQRTNWGILKPWIMSM